MNTAKQILIIASFLLFNYKCLADAKKMPTDIQKKLKTHHIPPHAVIMGIDMHDCNNCTIAFYKFMQETTQESKNKIYCFVSDQSTAVDLSFTIKHQNINFAANQIIIDKDISEWFEGACKAKNYIVQLNNTAYTILNINDENLNPSKLFPPNSIITDTLIIDINTPTTNNKLHQLNDTIISILNMSSNALFVTNTASKIKKIIFIDSLLNKEKVFEQLKLNSKDSLLTIRDNIKSNFIANRFINIVNFTQTPTNIFFAYYVNYTHEMNKQELIKLFEKAPKFFKINKININKDTLAKTQISKLFIAEFDNQLTLINNYVVNDLPNENYSVRGGSGLAFNIEKNEVVFNLRNMSTVKDENIYKTNNYTCGLFKFNTDTKTIDFIKFLPNTMPAWYAKSSVRINYSSGCFLKTDEKNDCFYLYSYPYAVDLSANIKYELPVEVLKIINKEEGTNFLNDSDPGYFILTYFQLKQGQKSLLFKGKKTNNLYIANFAANGNFIDYFNFGQTKAYYASYYHEKLYLYWSDEKVPGRYYRAEGTIE